MTSREPRRSTGHSSCPRKRAKGSSQKPCPSRGRDEGQAAQSPVQGCTSSPGASWSTACRGREQGQRWKHRGTEKELKERRRALGNTGPFGAEARRAPSRSGGALTTAWARCSPASVRLAPCPPQRLERIPLTAVSSSRSLKNRFKKKLPQCFSKHTASQRDLLQHQRRQRALCNLKKSPCTAQGGCPGQAGAFRKKAGNLLAPISSLPPRGAAGAETRARSEQSRAPPGHRSSQPAAHPGQAMVPVPHAGAGRDGPSWLHATVPNRPHAEHPGPSR